MSLCRRPVRNWRHPVQTFRRTYRPCFNESIWTSRYCKTTNVIYFLKGDLSCYQIPVTCNKQPFKNLFFSVSTWNASSCIEWNCICTCIICKSLQCFSEVRCNSNNYVYRQLWQWFGMELWKVANCSMETKRWTGLDLPLFSQYSEHFSCLFRNKLHMCVSTYALCKDSIESIKAQVLTATWILRKKMVENVLGWGGLLLIILFIPNNILIFHSWDVHAFSLVFLSLLQNWGLVLR